MIIRNAHFFLANLSKIEASLKEKRSKQNNSSCRRPGQFRIMNENNIVKNPQGAGPDDDIEK